jgi:hypothetical protein
METSSESAEEPAQRNQRSSRPFFVAAGKFAGFESPESNFDSGE